MFFDESLLEPFAGYFDLGMFNEANDALDDLPNELKSHPVVLRARLELLVEMERWDDGALLGQSLAKLWPEESRFYFLAAYCLHEMRRTAEAKAALIAAPAEAQTRPEFLYNAACYESQLGNIERARELLAACFHKDMSFREAALDDADLEPVWSRV